MIRTVVAKELLLLLRGTSFRVVLIGYLLALTAGYLMSYGEFATMEGVIPADMKQAFGKRVFMSQTILLTILTPWVVSRTMLSRHGDAIIRLIVLTALTPWKMMYGKLLATSMYLCQLLLLSLPVLLLTHLLGATSASDIVWSYIALFVWLTLVQLSTLCWNVLVATALPSFILSYVTLLMLSVTSLHLGSVIGETTRTLATAGFNVCLGLLLLRYCNKKLIYLSNPDYS